MNLSDTEGNVHLHACYSNFLWGKSWTSSGPLNCSSVMWGMTLDGKMGSVMQYKSIYFLYIHIFGNMFILDWQATTYGNFTELGFQQQQQQPKMIFLKSPKKTVAISSSNNQGLKIWISQYFNMRGRQSH